MLDCGNTHRIGDSTAGRTPGGALLAVALLLSMAACQDAIIGEPYNPGAPTDATPIGSPDAPLPPIDAQIDAQIDAKIDAPAPTTCDERYGQAVEYILCDERPDTCEFNARTDGGNCNQMCAAFGGTCVAAYDNASDPGVECDRVDSNDDCSTNRNTEICVCTRF